MIKLLESFFELLKVLVKGVFNLLQIIFGADPEFRKGKYSSQFMGLWDRFRLVSSWNKGVCINGQKRLTKAKSLEHTLVIGGSGSGKTSTVVIPSILRSNNSFICTDVDGTIMAKTSGDLIARGYKLQCLNFSDISRSVFYSPIHYCITDSDLKKLSELLISTAYPNSNSDNNFWNFGGQGLIYILLRLLSTQPKEYQNLANLRYLLQRYAQLDEFVVNNASLSVWNDWLGFVSAEEKIQSGMVSSALVALDKLSDSGISFLTSKNTLDFSLLLDPDQPCGIFIKVPESKLNFYSFLLSILYNDFFRFINLNKPQKIVTAYLDEFSQLDITDFPLYATTSRRYNLALVALIQNESQLIGKYGQSGYQTLYDGSFASKVIFPGMSLPLAQNLSQSFGRKGVVQSQTKPYLSDRELMTVQELIQLDGKKAVYTYRNKPPLILSMKPYFKQYSLRKRSRLKPLELEQNTIIPPPLINLDSDKTTSPLNPLPMKNNLQQKLFESGLIEQGDSDKIEAFKKAHKTDYDQNYNKEYKTKTKKVRLTFTDEEKEYLNDLAKMYDVPLATLLKSSIFAYHNDTYIHLDDAEFENIEHFHREMERRISSTVRFIHTSEEIKKADLEELKMNQNELRKFVIQALRNPPRLEKWLDNHIEKDELFLPKLLETIASHLTP